MWKAERTMLAHGRMPVFLLPVLNAFQGKSTLKNISPSSVCVAAVWSTSSKVWLYFQSVKQNESKSCCYLAASKKEFCPTVIMRSCLVIFFEVFSRKKKYQIKSQGLQKWKLFWFDGIDFFFKFTCPVKFLRVFPIFYFIYSLSTIHSFLCFNS